MIERLRAMIADPNPILVKELRATFRAKLYVRFLYLATGVVALLVLALGALIVSEGMPPAQVGQALFQTFLGVGLLVISFVAPGQASASITSEHERETWESLLLSGMSAWRIVFGKFAACYASIVLVLIAFSPVLGIAFLFGGVSPMQVAVGFGSLLVALAPAVALGIAISARLRSTRLAIVLSTFAFVPLALLGMTALAVLGDELAHPWGTGMRGPFFYTEALVTRTGEWDTWALVVGAPLYALAMPVWFFLASAVVGIRPVAEDRSKPMKVWAIAMAASCVPIACIAVASQAQRGDSGDMALVAVMVVAFVVIVFGLLFTNEPPLPPRAWEVRQASRSPLARALGAIGPGAAGTMRFSIGLSLLTTVAVTATVIITRRLVVGWEWAGSPMFSWHHHYDEACIALAVGAFVVAALAASLGAFLRIVLRNGLAARVLTLSILIAAAVLPFIAGLLVDPTSFGGLDEHLPMGFMLSVLDPLFIAIELASGTRGTGALLDLVVPVCLYGSLALVFAAQVEVRVRRAKKEAAARRARFAAEVASNAEPAP